MHRTLISALMGLLFVLSVLLLGAPATPAYAQEETTPAQPAADEEAKKPLVLKDGQYLASETEASNLAPAGRAKVSTSRSPSLVVEVTGERMRLKKIEAIAQANLEARRIDLERAVALTALEKGAQAYAEHDENGAKIAVGDATAPLGALVNGDNPIDMMESFGGVRQYGELDGLIQALALEQALQGDVPNGQQTTPPPTDDTKTGGGQTSGGGSGGGGRTKAPPKAVDLLKEAENR